MISLVLLARASHVAAANAWIHQHLDTAGGDNITIPLIGIADADTAEPIWYGCNYASLPDGSDKAFRTGVVNSPYVNIYVNTDFSAAIASQGLRVKPAPPLV